MVGHGGLYCDTLLDVWSVMAGCTVIHVLDVWSVMAGCTVIHVLDVWSVWGMYCDTRVRCMVGMGDVL